MQCSVTVQEEIVDAQKQVVYRDRPDMSGPLGECDVPSAARKLARVLFKTRFGASYTILSCGLMSRSVVKLLVREGPRPGAVREPGTVPRPPGVRMGKRIGRRRR